MSHPQNKSNDATDRRLLELIFENQERIMATLTDLDNALQTLTTATQSLATSAAAVVTDITTLLQKLASNPDYTNEVNQVQASLQTLNQTIANLQSGDQEVNPPATDGSGDNTTSGAGN